MTHKIIFITLASLTHFFSYFGPDEFSKIISSITYNISPFNKTTKIPCMWQVVPNTFPCKQLSLCINIFPLLFALFQTHALPAPNAQPNSQLFASFQTPFIAFALIQLHLVEYLYYILTAKSLDRNPRSYSLLFI